MTELPTMRGNARVAVGAGEFDVPLFSQIRDNIWMGCSPAEFPTSYQFTEQEYLSFLLGYESDKEVECKWLMEWDSMLLMDRPRFDAIINLYPWGKYKVPEGVAYKEYVMYDKHGDPDVETLEAAVSQALTWLRAGKKVLIHCQAGLNRSSLVTARVIMEKYGWSAREAIDLIRERRSPTCLCNQGFESYLLKLDRGSWS